MTVSRSLVVQIESAAYRSWPARQMVQYDGWELRLSDGFSRRGNSVYPAGVSTLDHAEKIEWCRRWYEDRGEQLVVRLTPASEPGLDDPLEEAGLSLEGRTDVMVCDVKAAPPEVAVIESAASTWWSTAASL